MGRTGLLRQPPDWALLRRHRKRTAVDETAIDRAAMGRLAKALEFILGANDPTTMALRKASDSGAERDIKAARTLFLRLKSSDRRAALTMLDD